MTLLDQSFVGIEIGKDYPFPVVNLEEAGRKAKDKIWGFRKNETVKKEALRVLQKHTHKNRNRIVKGKP